MLRDYQREIVKSLSQATSNTITQADTGAGKTRIACSLIRKLKGVVFFVVHRNILLLQSSKAFSEQKLNHDIIGSDSIKRRLRLKTGSKKVFICSVDTLVSKINQGEDLPVPTHIIFDEAHHVLEENKWGKVAAKWPNAICFGLTATPIRADGRALQKGYGGIFEKLTQAESLKENSVETLIKRNVLSDYKAYTIPCDIDFKNVKMSNGDYQISSQGNAMDGMSIFGDVVKQYQAIIPGKKAVVFCCTIKNAKEMVQKFRESNIPAAVISSKLPQTTRDKVMADFDMGLLNVLANVDIVGEGFDMPDLDAVIMLRKTKSYGLYRQWCGRALRHSNNKQHGYIIDHVGNVIEHGLPSENVKWELKEWSGGDKNNLIPCENCSFVFKAWLTKCPDCGHSNDIKRVLSNTGYVDQIQIDEKLVIARNAALKKEDFKRVFFDESLLYRGSGMIAEQLRNLQMWFVDCAKTEFSMLQINNFFESHKEINYWMQKFTIADMKKNNKSKVLKEMRSWK